MSTPHELFDFDRLPPGTPKRALADARGFKAYDTTLPQQWLDRVTNVVSDKLQLNRSEVYRNLRFGTVWQYDTSTLGCPGFITLQAHTINELFLAAEGDANEAV